MCVCVCACACLCLSVCVCLSFSVSLCVCLSVSLTVFVSLSLSPSLCLPCLWLSLFHLSLFVCVCLSVCLSVSLSLPGSTSACLGVTVFFALQRALQVPSLERRLEEKLRSGGSSHSRQERSSTSRLYVSEEEGRAVHELIAAVSAMFSITPLCCA